MKNDEKDPFAKFDHLFEENDKKSVVQPPKKEEPSFDDLKTEEEHLSGRNHASDKKRGTRIVLLVAFVFLVAQSFPLVFFNSGFNVFQFTPFMIVFFIIFVNIIIKIFKR